MLHVELNGNAAENTMQTIILSFYTLYIQIPQIRSKGQNLFSEVGHDAYQS